MPTAERVAARFIEAKTYSQAHKDLLNYLEKQGWSVSKGLKIPHATSPDGELRLWFKPQAIYDSSGSPHTFGRARSYTTQGLDVRTMSPEDFVKKHLKKDFPRVDLG
jgi:hypothetical protein